MCVHTLVFILTGFQTLKVYFYYHVFLGLYHNHKIFAYSHDLHISVKQQTLPY